MMTSDRRLIFIASLHLPLDGKRSMSEFLFTASAYKQIRSAVSSQKWRLYFQLFVSPGETLVPNLPSSQKGLKIKKDVPTCDWFRRNLGLKKKHSREKRVVIYNRSVACTVSVYHFCRIHPFWLEKSFLSFRAYNRHVQLTAFYLASVILIYQGIYNRRWESETLKSNNHWNG